MAKSFSVFVNVGAKLDSTFANVIGQAENRINRFSRVLQRNATMMRDAMRGVGSAAKEVSKLAAAGAGMHGAVDTFKHALKSGAELQGVRVDMTKAGIGKAEIEALGNQSLKLANEYRNVTQAGLMELGKEIRSVLIPAGDEPHSSPAAPATAGRRSSAGRADLGHRSRSAPLGITHPDEVAHVLPSMAAAKSLLDARDQTGAASAGLNLLVKGAEAIGAAQSPERFIKLVDGYVKAIQVMGKTITPESIYEFNKYSKLAGANLSDRFLMTTAQSLGQELGGSTAGVGIGGLYKQIAGGMQNQHTAAKEFARVGLIDPSALDRTKTGEIKGVKPGVMHAVKGDTVAASDPDKWVYDFVLPAIEKAGIRSAADQLAWVRKAFPNGNVADVIGKMIIQRHAFEAHAKQYDQATGLSGTNLNRDDPTAALGGLTKSLETFAGVLAAPVMQSAGHALDAMSGWVGSFSMRLDEFNKAHPTLAKAEAPIAGGVAVAGAAGAGGIVWRMLTGGFGLKGSAVALDQSAAALTAAAAKLAMAGGKPWSAPSVVEAPAAAAGASFGIGGSAIAAGAAAGAYFDWNLGGNPGAVGLLAGQESDHQKAMRYLREQGEARAAAAQAGLPPAWGAGKAKSLPGGSGAGKGYASSFEIDGGALHDFLWGKDRESALLPGFGSRSPLRLPEAATAGLKDQAAKAGIAAGESTATEIGVAIASKAGEIVEKAKGVFESVQSVFAAGISVPVRTAPLGASSPALAGARAKGGPVTGGKPYLVGENGPEIFVPNTTGRIETNGVLNSLSSAGGRATGDKGLTVGVDASAIEQAGETAKKSGAIITASLDTTTNPIVDTSSIEAATAAAEKLKAVLATVGGSSISVGGEGGGGAVQGGGASGGSSAQSVGGAASKAGAGPADASGGRTFGARADLTAGAKESYDFWREKGLSHAAAAGFAGSEQGENNFKAHGYGDKGHAYGSMMWQGPRQRQILAGTGVNVVGATHRQQLEAAFWEMTKGPDGGARKAWALAQGAKTPGEAAAIHVDHFERPLDRALNKRVRGGYANAWAKKFEGSAPPAAAVADAGKPKAAEAAGKPPVALAGAREHGGPVGRGLSYLVGERGPEIFTPGATGQISTNGTLNTLADLGRATVGGAEDGGSTAPDAATVAKLRPDGARVSTRGDTHMSNEWHIHGASDPSAVQRQVSGHFSDLLRQLESDQRGSLSD